jgi:rhodanese-related sulfurtransferase
VPPGFDKVLPMARPIDPKQRRVHRLLYGGIALAILGGVAWMVSIQAQSLDGTISLGELDKNLGQDPYNIVVLDTRPPDAFRQGHLPFAVGIPLEQLGRRLGELASAKDRQVAVMDENDERSKKAMGILAQAGFKSVVDAPDGMKAWREQGRRVVTEDDAPLHKLVQ